MAVVTKKILPQWFEKILSGEKRCEMRLGDFAIAPGDTLRLVEFDGQQLTGRSVDLDVDYVMNTKDATYWSAEEIERHGLQIIQFKKSSQA